MGRWNSGAVLALCALAAHSVGCSRGGSAPADTSAPPGAAASAGASAPVTQPTREDAPVLADFDARVKEYTALHQKLEDTLPKLSKESTPEQIDSHQRALGKLIQQARADAKPGDIFTADIQSVVKRLMGSVFGGPDGASLKASIMDENPGPIKLTVNGRYPDAVPLSTVPPQVLQGLPTLPNELEFRFIGRHLILMDEHAHVIVDVIDNVLPR